MATKNVSLICTPAPTAKKATAKKATAKKATAKKATAKKATAKKATAKKATAKKATAKKATATEATAKKATATEATAKKATAKKATAKKATAKKATAKKATAKKATEATAKKATAKKATAKMRPAKKRVLSDAQQAVLAGGRAAMQANRHKAGITSGKSGGLERVGTASDVAAAIRKYYKPGRLSGDAGIARMAAETTAEMLANGKAILASHHDSSLGRGLYVMPLKQGVGVFAAREAWRDAQDTTTAKKTTAKKTTAKKTTAKKATAKTATAETAETTAKKTTAKKTTAKKATAKTATAEPVDLTKRRRLIDDNDRPLVDVLTALEYGLRPSGPPGAARRLVVLDRGREVFRGSAGDIWDWLRVSGQLRSDREQLSKATRRLTERGFDVAKLRGKTASTASSSKTASSKTASSKTASSKKTSADRLYRLVSPGTADSLAGVVVEVSDDGVTWKLCKSIKKISQMHREHWEGNGTSAKTKTSSAKSPLRALMVGSAPPRALAAAPAPRALPPAGSGLGLYSSLTGPIEPDLVDEAPLDVEVVGGKMITPPRRRRRDDKTLSLFSPSMTLRKPSGYRGPYG